MRNRDAVLDRLRMLLAILVVVCHIQYFEELFEKEPIPNSWMNLPLLLGHQSVIVFFVLSGYFVGGQAYLRYSKEKFQVFHFVVERLTRLWVVLIPALFLTFTLNQVTCLSFRSSSYCTGNIDQGALSISPTDVSSLKVLLGNVFFLQGIRSPVFGSNLPLWSIAFEFWFYMSIPFLYFISKLQLGIVKAGALVLVLLVSLLMGFPLHWYIWFLCWFLGAVAFYSRRRFGSFRIKLSNKLFIPIVFSSMLCSRFLSGPLDRFAISTASDLGLAVIFSMMLWLRSDKIYSFRRNLSEFSFSIYAFHFPITVLVYFAFRERFLKEYDTNLLYRGLFPFVSLALIISCCWVLFLLTEKHYMDLRVRVFEFLSKLSIKRRR